MKGKTFSNHCIVKLFDIFQRLSVFVQPTYLIYYIAYYQIVVSLLTFDYSRMRLLQHQKFIIELTLI